MTAGGGKSIPTLEMLRQKGNTQPQIVLQRLALEGMPCAAAMLAYRYKVHFHQKTLNRWRRSDSYLATFAVLCEMRQPRGIRQ